MSPTSPRFLAIVMTVVLGTVTSTRWHMDGAILQMNGHLHEGLQLVQAQNHTVPADADAWKAAGYNHEEEHCPIGKWSSLYKGQADWSEPWAFQKPSQENREKYYSKADAANREAFWSKMLQCTGGLYMWGFGSLLNAWTIPQVPTDVHAYTITGLERGWASLGPANYEIMALGVKPNPAKMVTGGFSSHQRYVDPHNSVNTRCKMKQKWAESVWCREVTEANLKMEFIYVPARLRSLQNGQSFFKYGANAAPSEALKDACIYTNVPTKDLEAPTAAYRLLQTYIDTVMIGALVLGSDHFVEQTILTTGYWSPANWQNDRAAPYYVRSPRDIFKNYNGEHDPKTPRTNAGLYRFTFKTCIGDMTATHGSVSEAILICKVMAVCMEDEIKAVYSTIAIISCSADDYSAMQDEWLQRIAGYVDRKLGQAKLSYFDTLSGVKMGKETDKLPSEQWEDRAKVHGRLLSLRQSYAVWPRLCTTPSATPVWRGSMGDVETQNCANQTIEGDSYKKQRR